MEQKNNTLLEMGVYDDGPYEVGDENLLRPEFVPVPANSYLGEHLKNRCGCMGVTSILLVQRCTVVTSSVGQSISHTFGLSSMRSVFTSV